MSNPVEDKIRLKLTESLQSGKISRKQLLRTGLGLTGAALAVYLGLNPRKVDASAIGPYLELDEQTSVAAGASGKSRLWFDKTNGHPQLTRSTGALDLFNIVPYSYIIYLNGSTMLAKSTIGTPDFSGTDLSKVLMGPSLDNTSGVFGSLPLKEITDNNGGDHQAPDGTILFKSGQFSALTKIAIPPSSRLRICGAGTVYRASTGKQGGTQILGYDPTGLLSWPFYGGGVGGAYLDMDRITFAQAVDQTDDSQFCVQLGPDTSYLRHVDVENASYLSGLGQLHGLGLWLGAGGWAHQNSASDIQVFGFNYGLIHQSQHMHYSHLAVGYCGGYYPQYALKLDTGDSRIRIDDLQIYSIPNTATAIHGGVPHVYIRGGLFEFPSMVGPYNHALESYGITFFVLEDVVCHGVNFSDQYFADTPDLVRLTRCKSNNDGKIYDDDKDGIITGVATGSAQTGTTVSAEIAFNASYIPLSTVNVILQARDVNAAVVLGIPFASLRSGKTDYSTGFTYNLPVVTGSGTTTCSLLWSARHVLAI